MHKVAIGGLILIGVGFFGLLKWIGSQPPEPQEGKQQESPADQSNRTALSVNNQARSNKDRKSYKADCSKKDQADLCAQMRMAEAAENQSFYTLMSLALLALATIATGLAARYAKRAAQYAKDAADAGSNAVDAAVAANRIMKDEQRPWIDFDTSVAAAFQRQGDSDYIAVPLKIKLINCGNAPALNIVLNLSVVRTKSFDNEDEANRLVAERRKTPDQFSLPVVFPRKDVTDTRVYGLREVTQAPSLAYPSSEGMQILTVAASYRWNGDDMCFYTAQSYHMTIVEPAEYGWGWEISPLMVGRIVK